MTKLNKPKIERKNYISSIHVKREPSREKDAEVYHLPRTWIVLELETGIQETRFKSK